jgi:hypothetical protein
MEKYSPNCIGLALELPLLEWLEKYTFPTEAKFSQSKFSTEVRKIQYSTVRKGFLIQYMRKCANI